MEFLRRTWAEIDISALKSNFDFIKKIADGSKIMAVVKANAYGHDAAIVAPLLQKEGADAFAVATLDEAVNLRGCGITKPILIFGYTPPEAAGKLAANDITQCVYSAEYAEALAYEAEKKRLKIKVFIKLDTGMSRLGFDCRTDELCGIDAAVCGAAKPQFEVKGVFTHFCAADRVKMTDDGFTDAQYKRFEAAKQKLRAAGVNAEFSCRNSAAVLQDREKGGGLCRPGIILYGLAPAAGIDNFPELTPVMTLKSVVSMVKEIRKGETVSYGRKFTAERNMKVATVSAGYADGYPRILSGRAYVLINGVKAPILGRVCMDQMVVDATGTNAKPDDEVILFGKELSVTKLAEAAGTINYEIVCGVSPRVPRIAVESEK